MNKTSVYMPYRPIHRNSTKIGDKSFWVAFCLTFPVVAKIVLPSSLESLLEINIAGIPLFLPNILLFVFFANSIKNHGDLGLKVIFGVQVFFMLVGFLYNSYSRNPLAFLLAGNYYYYILLLGLYGRINNMERYEPEPDVCQDILTSLADARSCSALLQISYGSYRRVQRK